MRVLTTVHIHLSLVIKYMLRSMIDIDTVGRILRYRIDVMAAKLIAIENPRAHATFKTISNQLKQCNIDLEKFIKSDLKVYDSTIAGISFITQSDADETIPYDITAAFRRATKAGGLPVFREGNKLNAAHFAIDVSMANTIGIGFREIWDPVISDHGSRIKEVENYQSSLGVTPLKAPFSDHFGERLNRIDVSSLHAAIHGNHCSIHIDETGFVLRGIPGISDDVSVSAEFGRHTLLELLWQEKLGMPNFVDLVVPDSQHSRFGVRAKIFDTPSFRLEVNASCGIKCRSDWSTTITASGTHSLLGG